MTGKRRADPPPGRRRKGRSTPPEPTTERPPPGPTNPVPPGFDRSDAVIAPIKSRRQQRLELRARRRRIGRLGILGVVAAVAIAGAAVGFGVHTITESPPPAADRQTTLFLQIAGTGGGSVGGMLMGHETGTANGVELLVPASLITSVCGFGQQSFGEILALPGGAEKSASALSALLDHMRIDGTWTLTESQLAALVSAVGGVSVDVDVDVTRPGAHGTAVVEIPRGKQALNAAQAVQFATYHASRQEDASAQLARLQSVVQAAIDKLPRSATGVQRIVSRLGSGATSTLGARGLASLLVALGSDDRHDGGVLASDLPTTRLETGGAPSYNIDTEQAQQFVRSNFAASLPKHPPAGFSVLIENGYGTPGLVPSACQRLSAGGLQVTGGGNSSTTGQQKTQILVSDRTVADAEKGDEVARLLHLPQSEVQVNPVPSSNEDVVVVLGRDYKP